MFSRRRPPCSPNPGATPSREPQRRYRARPCLLSAGYACVARGRAGGDIGCHRAGVPRYLPSLPWHHPLHVLGHRSVTGEVRAGRFGRGSRRRVAACREGTRHYGPSEVGAVVERPGRADVVRSARPSPVHSGAEISSGRSCGIRRRAPLRRELHVFEHVGPFFEHLGLAVGDADREVVVAGVAQLPQAVAKLGRLSGEGRSLNELRGAQLLFLRA
jgi:hypothetical protein